MKQLLLSLITSVMLIATASAQTISGRVTDENTQPVSFANIVLLSGDSTFVNGTITDENGNYSIVHDERAKMLRVSCLGFETSFIDININENYGQIILKSADSQLDEITITAHRQLTQIKGDALVTNISGSPIAKLADVGHVLNVIPGIVSQDESIKVLGKGEPLVYINNRKISDLSEVYQLSPDNIKTIELIRNPGAKYDAEVKAVLKITTIAPTGEGFAIDNKLSIGHQFDNFYMDNNLKINYRYKNLDLFAAASYGKKNFKENVLSTDETFLSSYYNMFTDINNNTDKQPFSSKLGFNYAFKSGNSIGFEYSNKLQMSDVHYSTLTNLREDGNLTENLNSSDNGDKNTGYHLVNLYNSGSLLSWDYEIDFDAMHNFNEYNHTINEQSDAGNDIVLNCNEENDASLYAFKLEANKEIFKGDVTLGTEHSFVDRSGESTYLQNADNNTDYRLKENNSAIYTELTQDFSLWSFTLGLRYEFVKSNYYENSIKRDDCCRSYHNWFPSVSVDFFPGDAEFSLCYERSIQRPYYEQLGNNIGFINRYAYETGNPLLRPAFYDDFSLMVTFKDFTFMADYMINHDYIYEAYSSYGDNEQVSLLKHENYDKFNAVQLSLAYNHKFGFYRPNFYVSIFRQDMWINFRNEKKVFDKPSGVIRINNLFELPWQTTLNAGFDYFTPGDDELGWVDENYSFNIDISKIFGNWTVSFVCDDVFKTTNTYFNFYGAIRKCTIEKLSDTRKLELSIRYKLNSSKSKYKGTGAVNDEKERM